MKTVTKQLALTSALCLLAPATHALDLTEGLMFAVPTPNNQAPTINGDLTDFDLSGAEPMWITPQTIGQLRANVALMYDDDALYLGATVSLPGREINNRNNPTDAFWNGDVLELRLASDPKLPAPLNINLDSDRIVHLTMWKNSETGEDFLYLNFGAKLEKEKKTNPAGSKIVISPKGNEYYTVEARIPWSVLNVPNGKNPFVAGEKMSATLSPRWGGETQTAALYRTNPGAFAWNRPQTWGQVEFSAQGNLVPRHETMQQLLARYAIENARKPAAVGVPFTVDVPAESKVSVNIFGPNGEVIRELMGGEAHEKGELTLHWDGKDQWGQGVAAGDYRWGAYFSKGLKAQYVGGVGSSGAPHYETADGKGGWGADHSDPIDVAADASGVYFLWPIAEAGRAVVKLDYNGKVLWRKTPFVGGGFGPFYSLATDGKFVYMSLGKIDSRLVRLNAATGQLLPWSEQQGTVLPVDKGELVEVRAENSVTQGKNAADFHNSPPFQPQSVGVATDGRVVYLSVYGKNLIHVLDAVTGAKLRTLSVPGPRGLNLDSKGNLFAASFVEDVSAQIVRFAGGKGAAQSVVSKNLQSPWDVTTGKDGRLFVSDLGASQQIKVFDAKGKLLKSFGRAGGRAWQGKTDESGFLRPAGLTLDKNGDLMVAESAIPKIFNRMDAQTGAVKQRWFGPPVYWASTWPSPDDPRVIYTAMPGGVAQYTLPKNGGDQPRPDAYWALDKAGFPDSANFESGFGQPDLVRANNGRDYMVADTKPFTIALKTGDKLRPVAGFMRNERNEIEVWADKNGDGRQEENEKTFIKTVAGKPVHRLPEWTDSMRMEPNGDIYFMTQDNSILKIPAAPMGADGALRWDASAASYAIPQVLPSTDKMVTAWRTGLHGVRLDKAGNFYTIFNTKVGGGGKPYEYATPELAKDMIEGLGHASTFNTVKMAKFDPQGKLVWMAGRKATSAPKAGEMLHFWNMAGLINDKYIVGGSEWGPIYLYTTDGFYVDALMNNPGLNPPPGPYTFGGETAGARVKYFADRDELWAYTTGRAYKVEGFVNGKVAGESRASGTVNLDRVYEAEAVAPLAATPPVQLVALNGNPLENADVWDAAPVSTLTREGETLATAQLGYDANFVYARIRVTDETPLQNAADTIATALKGGDTAGFVIGPKDKTGAGQVRFMAAKVNGADQLIAMKVATKGAKKPEIYFTPSAGEVKFEFVGEVPGGRVILTPVAGGYMARMAIPRAFIEFDIMPDMELAGDIEVRLSGNGQRGVQATSRNYLFTPSNTKTSMTDDVPTEARMYPEYWGRVLVK